VRPRERADGDDGWWRDPLDACEVLARKSPEDWGREFHLYKNSMNPAMTASFMRRGRLAHKSPYVPGLFLAGSSTHPGQWVSFSAISGILAADQLHEG
jgi:phytoene dehydrogenase-like protein